MARRGYHQQPHKRTSIRGRRFKAGRGTTPVRSSASAYYVLQKRKKARNPLIKKAKKRFGTTDNPLEAGYILPDGKMLDFSGEGVSNDRRMDHNEVKNIMSSRGDVEYSIHSKEASDDAIKFRKETKSMRFMKYENGSIYVETNTKPTPEQIKTINEAMNTYPRSERIELERTNDKGIVSDRVKHRLETDNPHPILVQKFVSRAFD